MIFCCEILTHSKTFPSTYLRPSGVGVSEIGLMVRKITISPAVATLPSPGLVQFVVATITTTSNMGQEPSSSAPLWHYAACLSSSFVPWNCGLEVDVLSKYFDGLALFSDTLCTRVVFIEDLFSAQFSSLVGGLVSQTMDDGRYCCHINVNKICSNSNLKHLHHTKSV